ncbi:hypothetical protein VNO77_04005 [Canavalia gladiata]|uniref:Uncharacterized protein n=1 Tax=Canavalia gladiata TaxID=3824 RepID=A0AAN9N295_CANGL
MTNRALCRSAKAKQLSKEADTDQRAESKEWRTFGDDLLKESTQNDVLHNQEADHCSPKLQVYTTQPQMKRETSNRYTKKQQDETIVRECSREADKMY